MPRFWPSGGLWRHGDFLKLWSAETISQFGSQAGQLALPLVAILVLDASAFEVAALGERSNSSRSSSSRCPPACGSTDLPRRPILIAGDFGRAALLATIPIAYVADVAHARPALRRRVPRRRLPRSSSTSRTSRTSRRSSSAQQIIEGNSKLEISRSAAQVAGPGFAWSAGPDRSPRRGRSSPTR